MSEPIRIQIDAPNLARLRLLQPGQLLAVIRLAMDRTTPLVHGLVTKERFTGQGPFPVSAHRLGVKTGNLRRQLRWTRAQVANGVITASIGAPVVYFGAHEFGFSGSVNVKAHQRQIARVNGRITTQAAAAKASKSRRKVKPEVSISATTVKAHARQLNIPARAPLQTGIREHYSREFNEALARELQNLSAT